MTVENVNERIDLVGASFYYIKGAPNSIVFLYLEHTIT